MGLLNARSLTEKTACLNIFCREQGLHFFLNETWQQEGDFTPLIEPCPRDGIFSARRRTGGGLATLFKDLYNCQQISFSYSSFKLQILQIPSPEPTIIAHIYRPTEGKQFKETENWPYLWRETAPDL